MIFVDTSAFYAILDANDRNHAGAAAAWRELVAHETELFTTNYVLLETSAIVQARLGLEALADLYQALLPLVTVEFVDAGTHEAALHLVLAEKRRLLSLVDCASFIYMRRGHSSQALAYDKHFVDFGFQLVGQ
ncbi:MAG: PIN domain-containing protein [Candidatus Eremiobacteraeota bacterium]|nr:PIN domain-containing protein [Candidatus Eremiobacteraeota bacterium]